MDASPFRFAMNSPRLGIVIDPLCRGAGGEEQGWQFVGHELGRKKIENVFQP